MNQFVLSEVEARTVLDCMEAVDEALPDVPDDDLVTIALKQRLADWFDARDRTGASNQKGVA